MHKLLLAFGLLTVSFFATAKEHRSSLRALVVYNDEPSNLQGFYAFDAQQVRKTCEGIAYHTKMRLRLKVCKESEFSQNLYAHWLQSIPSKGDDIAFFYYSGRSPQTSGTSNPWPSLKLNKNGSEPVQHIAKDQIAQDIKQRHTRLGLVFFDCYEKVVSIPKQHFSIIKPLSKTGPRRNFKRLFVKAKGMVAACSTERNGDAYGIEQGRPCGGLFTRAFVISVQTVSPKTFQWKMVDCDLRALCKVPRYVNQTPHISIDVSAPPTHYFPFTPRQK